VAHIYNPSYLGDQEDYGSRPAWANSLRDLSFSKIARAKWAGDVAQMVEYLFCKHETLSSNSNPTKKNDVCKGRDRETDSDGERERERETER
jgi:hypothetical protein